MLQKALTSSYFSGLFRSRSESIVSGSRLVPIIEPITTGVAANSELSFTLKIISKS